MSERPPARYGGRTTGRGNRLVVAAVTALAVVAGLAVAYVGWRQFADEDVSGEVATFRVLDDRTVEITLGVTRKDPSRPVVCIVRARSYDGDESGRRELLVAPSEDKTVQVTTVVQTSKPAVVGDLYGCGLDVPDYLTTG